MCGLHVEVSATPANLMPSALASTGTAAVGAEYAPAGIVGQPAFPLRNVAYDGDEALPEHLQLAAVDPPFRISAKTTRFHLAMMRPSITVRVSCKRIRQSSRDVW
jgi:hypothetical protein